MNIQEKYRQLNDKLNTNSFILEIFPNAVKKGKNYVIGNIGGDKGDSLTIFTDTASWKDFATGNGGDLISAYATTRGLSQGKAYEELSRRYGINNNVPQITDREKEMKEDKSDFFQWVNYEGNLDDDFIINTIWRQTTQSKSGYPDPEYIYRYYDKDDTLLMLVLRLPPHAAHNNKKDFKPFVFGIRGREKAPRWHMKVLHNPRPLYNLHNWSDARKFTVIVEGEKCVDALQKYIGAMANIITWIGGSNAVSKADWEAIRGSSKVMIIPDNDEAGYTAAKIIHNIINENKLFTEKLITASIPEGKPSGWDVADFVSELEASGKDVKAELKAFFTEASKERKSFKGDDGWIFDSSIKQSIRDLKKFQCLGYGETAQDYYFYSFIRNTVEHYNSKELKETAKLKVLAEDRFWEACFGQETKQGIKWDLNAIETALINCSHKMGMFDTTKKRNIGAFTDDGSVVVHLGDKLIVDGKQKPLDLDSQYIYSRHSERLDIDINSPLLSNDEAKEMWHALSHLKFKHTLDLRFLMGWYFAAPVSGIWKWRTHIWVTGESQAGKTTVITLLNALLKSFKKFYNNSTEAGIRQALDNKPLPVIFDEFEKDAAMVDAVLSLMRTCCSDNDAEIIRGTAGHNVKKFNVKSMFFAASTMSSLKLVQDHNRYISIRLLRNTDYKSYEKYLLHAPVTWVEKNYPDKFLMRSFAMARVMQENWQRFQSAILNVTKDARASDVLTTVSVGAWFFLNDIPPTDEQLIDYVKDYATYKEEKGTGVSDFEECWDLMSNKQVKMEVIKADGFKDYFSKTIGELILHLMEVEVDCRIGKNENAEVMLKRYGIRWINKTEIAVATNHAELEKLYRDTNYSNGNWIDGLMRGIEEYYKGNNDNKVMRFGGHNSRCIIIDPRFIIKNDKKEPF